MCNSRDVDGRGSKRTQGCHTTYMVTLYTYPVTTVYTIAMDPPLGVDVLKAVSKVGHPDMVRFEQSRRLYYIILYSSFYSYSKSVKVRVPVECTQQRMA